MPETPTTPLPAAGEKPDATPAVPRVGRLVVGPLVWVAGFVALGVALGRPSDASNLSLFALVWVWTVVHAFLDQYPSSRAAVRPRAALILHLLGAALVAVGFAVGNATSTLPMLPVAYGVAGVAALALAGRAWPDLMRSTFTYAVFAGVLVVATLAAVGFGWGRAAQPDPAGLSPDAEGERVLLLVATQFLVWVPATVCLSGVYAAVVVLRRNQTAADLQFQDSRRQRAQRRAPPIDVQHPRV